MDENQDSINSIVSELKKIKKRLDRIHSWIAVFIILYVLSFFISIWLMMMAS